MSPSTPSRRVLATLAGGRFWGVQELLRPLPGVLETTVGYTGGELADPTHEQVQSGRSGHAEAVQVAFDPGRVSYAQVLEHFFRLHNPTTANRQGDDVGTQYRSTIFVHDADQREVAENVRARVNRAGKWRRPVVTGIVAAGRFYPAASEHQDYLRKNPGVVSSHRLRE